MVSAAKNSFKLSLKSKGMALNSTIPKLIILFSCICCLIAFLIFTPFYPRRLQPIKDFFFLIALLSPIVVSIAYRLGFKHWSSKSKWLFPFYSLFPSVSL
jgi:amino acid transporter